MSTFIADTFSKLRQFFHTLGTGKIPGGRHRKTRAQLTFVKQRIRYIYHPSTVFPNFRLSSDSYIAKSHVCFVPFGVVNTGMKDITSQMPNILIFRLNSNFRWIDCTINKQSVGSQFTVDFKPESITISFTKFKKDEFILFYSLVESSQYSNDIDNVFNHLSIIHRIPEINHIKKKRILAAEERSFKFNFQSILQLAGPSLIVVSLMALLYFFVARSIIYKPEFRYETIHQGNVEILKAKPIDDTTVSITNLTNEEEYNISITDFQSQNEYKPIIQSKRVDQNIYVNILNIISVLFIYFVLDYISPRKRKIYKILKKHKNQNSK